MKKSAVKKIFLIAVPLIAVILIICLVLIPRLKSALNNGKDGNSEEHGKKTENTSTINKENISSAVDFDHELSTYQPKKDHYNFYFTYKTVHAWWDAAKEDYDVIGVDVADESIISPVIDKMIDSGTE